MESYNAVEVLDTTLVIANKLAVLTTALSPTSQQLMTLLTCTDAITALALTASSPNEARRNAESLSDCFVQLIKVSAPTCTAQQLQEFKACGEAIKTLANVVFQPEVL